MKRKEIEFVLVRMLDMDSDMPRAMEEVREWPACKEGEGERRGGEGGRRGGGGGGEGEGEGVGKPSE